MCLHCNTLQHTATHCNTLQHTATHCNTLPHTATYCNALQHTATHCNALQHTATHCNALQHSETHCNMQQHTATQTQQLKEPTLRQALICRLPKILGHLSKPVSLLKKILLIYRIWAFFKRNSFSQETLSQKKHVSTRNTFSKEANYAALLPIGPDSAVNSMVLGTCCVLHCVCWNSSHFAVRWSVLECVGVLVCSEHCNFSFGCVLQCVLQCVAVCVAVYVTACVAACVAVCIAVRVAVHVAVCVTVCIWVHYHTLPSPCTDVTFVR